MIVYLYEHRSCTSWGHWSGSSTRRVITASTTAGTATASTRTTPLSSSSGTDSSVGSRTSLLSPPNQMESNRNDGYFLNLKGEKAIVLFYFTCVSDDVMLLCCSGTFAEEKDDEEISYGLVFPVNSWDLVYIQVAVTQNQDIFLTYMYVLVLYISTTCTLVCIVSISCFLP